MITKDAEIGLNSYDHKILLNPIITLLCILPFLSLLALILALKLLDHRPFLNLKIEVLFTWLLVSFSAALVLARLIKRIVKNNNKFNIYLTLSLYTSIFSFFVALLKDLVITFFTLANYDGILNHKISTIIKAFFSVFKTISFDSSFFTHWGEFCLYFFIINIYISTRLGVPPQK
jgi:hypothetical protein